MNSPYSRRNRFQKNRTWAPKIWLGAELSGWIRLLRENRFAFGWKYLPWIAFITFAASWHSGLGCLQELIWGKRVRETRIELDPLFIIGHWRTGTTWLHELLCVDDRLTYPTTYECLDPNHFLLTERLSSNLLSILAPSRRPMDAMPMAFDRPQEDEFALCNLGQPSPYLRIAFPNHSRYQEYFDLEQLTPEEVRQWQQCLVSFLRQITLRRPKRIVLKSPTHTYRINLLMDLFPNAKFIHLVRNPYVLFPSTVHTWKSLWRTQGLQTPTYEGLEEYVIENFIRMYERLDEARPRLNPTNFYELRYEDLVTNPLEALRDIYRQLGLGDFDPIAPHVEAYMQDTGDYRVNEYPPLAEDVRETVTRRWGPVIQRYGYACDDGEPTHENRCLTERERKA